jgi:hypothetical protein
VFFGILDGTGVDSFAAGNWNAVNVKTIEQFSDTRPWKILYDIRSDS